MRRIFLLFAILAMVLTGSSATEAARRRRVSVQISSPDAEVAQTPDEASPPSSGPQEILEATGMLEALEGGMITLSAQGGLYSSPLSADCVFLDEQRRNVGRDDFYRLYLKRYVTVELTKDSGEVLSCRVGS